MINTLLFVLLALFWGGSFLFIKIAIEHISSFHAAFYRVFFAMIFLILLNIRSIKIPSGLNTKDGVLLISASLFSIGIPFSLLFWGEQYVSSGMAGVINGTVPIWTLLFGMFVFKNQDKVNIFKALGVFLGVIGIVLIFYPKISFNGDVKEIYGLISILFMAICYGLGIHFNNKIIPLFNDTKKGLTKETNLIIQQFFSALYLFVLSFSLEGIPSISNLLRFEVWTSLIYLSLFSTAIAFMIFYKLIMAIGPVKSSAVTFFVPLVALSLDIIINGIIPIGTQFLGAGIIMISLYFVRKD